MEAIKWSEAAQSVYIVTSTDDFSFKLFIVGHMAKYNFFCHVICATAIPESRLRVEMKFNF